MKKGGKVIIVVGGQWGSEAKGTFIGHLTLQKPIDYAVRTGSINAGHTVPYAGKFYAMQQLPVSWIDQKVDLVVGRGAYVEYELIMKEIAMIKEALGSDQSHRIFVDPMCGVHTHEHMEREQSANLGGKMGSTAHGCMEAQIERMRRTQDYLSFRAWCEKNNLETPWQWMDTERLLNEAYDEGMTILLEGTQGTGLDFLHGDYPYVTTRPTIASHWLTEAGLSPKCNTEIAMVCRTFPIRVAGNSGAMGHELGWADLARRVGALNEELLVRFEAAELAACTELGLPNRPHLIIDASERVTFSNELRKVHALALSKMTDEDVTELRKFFEITTVTKLLRRIAEPSDHYMLKAIRLNRPDYLVLNFVNYEIPSVNGATSETELLGSEAAPAIRRLLAQWEQAFNVPVKYLGINKTLTIESDHFRD